jgi:hypothetical protein
MPRQKTDIGAKIRKYDTQNLECARIFLSDQGRYGGERSLMVTWAKLVIERLGSESRNGTKTLWEDTDANALWEI